VRTIILEESTHFSAAYNIGLAEAKGEYLITINDDTLVPPNWNLDLRAAHAGYASKYGEAHGVPAPAIVGPMSNYVGGNQCLPPEIAQQITPQNYIDAGEQIAEQNPEVWVPVGFISGFCQFFDRGWYTEACDGGTEYFDERLKNGAEDNLVCLKALFAGHSLVAVGDVFVYHYGSQTIVKTDPEGGRGVRNLFDYYKIANEEVVPQDSQIAGVCRVQLTTPDHLKHFKMAVTKAAESAHALFFVNDRSDKDLWAKAEAHIKKAAGLKKNKIPYRIHTYSRGDHDEYRDRCKYVEMVRAFAEEQGDPESRWWILSFDADEVFENKVNRKYLSRLVNPPKPDMLQYSVHWYTFWDQANTMWRADSTFGKMFGCRLARLLPNYQIKKTESGLHMGNVPGVTVAGLNRLSSIRVKHYGYSTQEERQRKYDFYSEIDKVVNLKEVGNEGYGHLLPSMVTMIPWIEDNAVAVGTCVLNEEIRIHGFMDGLWAMADQMVFCDTGSDDRTVELLEYFGAKVIHYEEETGEEWDRTFATKGGNLGKARNTIFPYITTQWFWHHDIDETLIPVEEDVSTFTGNPHAVVRRLMENREALGYQFMFRNHHPSGQFTISQATRLIRMGAGKEWYYHGYTHETLDECTEGEKIDLCPIHVMHAGWLTEEAPAKEKLKRYLRGNLRMMMDFPDDPRGWFNTALHLHDAEMDRAATKFTHQAVVRQPHFAAARKEQITQGAKQLFAGCKALSEVTPAGHPFDQFARAVAEAVKPWMADTSQFRRSPEHVMEVLQEEGFEPVRDMIFKLEGIENAESEANRR
jgi:glycosyltransferase involved in cell wall biosynthesis